MEENDISAKETLSTSKEKLDRNDALKILDKVDEVYAKKGRKLVHYNLKKEKPSEIEISRTILGPTGNLRAPAIIKGRKLLIGFDEEVYDKVLK